MASPCLSTTLTLPSTSKTLAIPPSATTTSSSSSSFSSNMNITSRRLSGRCCSMASLPFLAPQQNQIMLRYNRHRRSQSHVVRMAPDEEKLTRRNPLDFPIEWERPKPGRRPDIFPQFSPMKTPLPPPLPYDPPEEEEDEEEKKEEEEEDPDKEEPDKQ